MKKIKWIAILFAIVVSMVLAGCLNPTSGGGESNTKPVYLEGQGVVARENIEFDSKTFDKTKEIVIIPTGTQAVIEITEDPIDYYGQGVFIKDRKVTLSPFVMSAYEVTQELYEAVMGSNPSYCVETNNDYNKMLEGEKQDLRPVENVTWYDAVNFCNELTKMTMTESDCVYTIADKTESSGHITNATVTIDITKKGYRLPTEAEWEFAARGGDPTADDWKYAYSGVQTEKASGSFTSSGYDKDLYEYAWYLYNISGEDNKTISSGTKGYGTHEVGTKKPNKLGLYDMSGNVWEWCWDKYDSITTDDVADPLGVASSSSYRVLRGGSWYINAFYSSVSYRGGDDPGSRSSDIGFRLVRSSS